MGSLLHVQLFGGVQLIWGDSAPSTLHPPRLEGLLAFLILHRDAPQMRQHLAFLFFPDSPEAQARTNLRNLLHLLHQALPQADCFLRTDSQTVQWRADAPFTLDVACFESALQTATDAAGWHTAVEMYRGDLVPNCYDDWILPERERLRLEYVEALERLVMCYEQEENFFAARKYAQRLLVTDPLREETYRHLMRLSALNGDRAGVVRYHNQCVNVLARELAVEPGAETLATYQAALRRTTETRVDKPNASEQKPRHNLPLQLTSLIGRAEDVRNVSDEVLKHRLVTFVGAGGVGKTRLALATALALLEHFADGVWYVDLAPLGDGRLVSQAIATVLNLRESSDTPLAELIANFLREKLLLLVLDNCEHVLANAQHLTQEFLRAAPQTHILATSRQALSLHGEFVWHTLPLALPDERGTNTIGELMQSPAVQLFVERATTVFAAFGMTDENADAVLKICRRLDGIPLAIELAAARVSLLTAPEIAARLEDTFHLLARGATQEQPHHQTMRAALDWSYETLSDVERILFRRLAVFAGGFTVEAAEAVCADNENARDVQLGKADILDLVANLIDKSLVATYSNDHKPRLRLLEPIREYARAKLEDAGEADSFRDRHLDFYVAIAAESEPQLRGASQDDWLIRLDDMHDNLRAAAEWSQCPARAEKGLRLVGSLSSLFFSRSYFTEWRNRAEKLLRQAESAGRTLIRAKALIATALLADDQGDLNASTEYLKQAAAIAREHGALGKPLLAWALTELSLSEYANKPAYAEEATVESWALLQELDDDWLIATWLHYKGHEFQSQNNLSMARTLYAQSRKLFLDLGDRQNAVVLFRDMAYLNFLEGDYSTARAQVEETLAFFRAHKEWKETQKELRILGEIAHVSGDYELAEKRYNESLALSREYADHTHICMVLSYFGLTVLCRGDMSSAKTLFEEELELAQEIGIREVARAIERFALLATVKKQAVRAAKLVGYAETQKRELGIMQKPTDARERQEILAFIHSTLDQKEIQAAWEAGAAMTKEQAIAYALQED